MDIYSCTIPIHIKILRKMKTLLQASSMILFVFAVSLMQQCQIETNTSDEAAQPTSDSTTSVEEGQESTDDVGESVAEETTPVTPVEELEEQPIAPIDNNEDLRVEIAKYASTYLDKGIKYSDPVEGATFDCSGFTSHILKKFDIDFTGSSDVMATKGKAIELEDAKVGDLIFFIRKADTTNRVFHVGIIENTEKDENGEVVTTILHSRTSKGPWRDRIPEPYYWNTDKMKIFARDILSDS